VGTQGDDDGHVKVGPALLIKEGSFSSTGRVSRRQQGVLGHASPGLGPWRTCFRWCDYTRIQGIIINLLIKADSRRFLPLCTGISVSGLVSFNGGFRPSHCHSLTESEQTKMVACCFAELKAEQGEKKQH